jgi:hypothetical protein
MFSFPYFTVEPMTTSPLEAPALTFVLIFIFVFSFLEKLIEVDCGENRRSLSQVAESRWILLANIFQRIEFRLARSRRDGR